MYEREIDSILSEMTLEEKAYALTPKDNQYCCIPSKGIAGPTPQDVPGGGQDNWRSYKTELDKDGKPMDGKYHPVAFPSNSAVAMSWDREFTYHIGQLFALEARANPDKLNILNRPGMNLKRSPLCGRNYDYFSEDPVLTGILAIWYVKGVQSADIGACPKHFIANNQEFDRMNSDSVIPERVLHEVYLKPWKMVIQEGKPWMIMSSYNKVNGEWVNSNKECMELLRKEIGFDGVVVSDFMAIHNNKVAAHNNTMDIELATPENHTPELLEALKTGEVTEETVDALLRRQLKMALHFMSLDNTAEADMKALHEEAKEAATRCIALLKNDGVLPVEVRAENGSILVAGALAENPNVAGSGSGYMNGYLVEKPLENIRRLAEERSIEIKYTSGYRLTEYMPPVNPPADTGLLAEVEKNVKELRKGDLILAFVGAPYGWESEGYDRQDLELPQNQKAMLDTLTEYGNPVIIILTGGSVYHLTPWANKVKGVLYTGMAGEGYGAAVADILFGRAEPGGRLAETFPLELCHEPAYFDFAGEQMELPHVSYSEGLLVGYRWFETRHLPVLFPFGHGMSYTTFAYSNFRIDKESITAKDKVTLSLDITNTGNRAGSQVIQLYVHELGGLFRRPEKELKDFEKVYLQPGEVKMVTFCLGREAFEVYSDVLHKWGVQEDIYELLLNVSAAENIWSTRVQITEGDEMFRYTEMTPLVWFLKSAAFHSYLKENCARFLQDFFMPGKSEFLVLMMPLPFYRLAEPLQGEPFFTKEQIKDIVSYCNRPLYDYKH